MFDFSTTSLVTIPPPAYQSSSMGNTLDGKPSSESVSEDAPQDHTSESNSLQQQSYRSPSHLESQITPDLPSSSLTCPPFQSQWITYLPILFVSMNIAAYTTLFWLLNTLSKVTGLGLLSRQVQNQLDPSTSASSALPPAVSLSALQEDDQSASKLCSVLSTQRLSAICSDPSYPASYLAAASTLGSSPTSSSLLQYRTTVGILSGTLAFLVGTTIALLIVDLLLHRYILKRRRDLVQQKPGDEEMLAEMKVGWSHNTTTKRDAADSPRAQAEIGDHTRETEERISSPRPENHPRDTTAPKMQALKTNTVHFFQRRCFSQTIQHEPSDVLHGKACFATILSTTRWTFSRLFLIVPIWIPLTEHPHWVFAALQAVVGLVMGFVIHRRSRMEVKRW